MSNKKRVESPEDLVNALDELFNELLLDEPEEAEAVLRENGYDPTDLGKKLAEFARHASSTSPLDWRNRREELERSKSEIGISSKSKVLGRADKLTRLQELLAMQSDKGLALAFRNFEQLSDTDLDSLLAQIEYLQSRKKAAGAQDKDKE